MRFIQDLIEENQIFVGRQRELSLMEQSIMPNLPQWGVTHLHGPAGIGKTVLLKQFERLHARYPSIYIDGHQGIAEPADFLAKVHDQLLYNNYIAEPLPPTPANIIREINKIACEHPFFLIFLDGLEQWGIAAWLQHEWLKGLHIHAKVFSAGRDPLDDWQLAFGWEQLVRNVEVQPLSKQEWMQYANLCGITEARLLYRIGIVTAGIPLAVSMACSWIKQQELVLPSHDWDFRPLMESMNRYFLGENCLNGVDKKLLTLASLTYTFDQELLEYMLGEPISAAAFAQLCKSPFVSIHANGGWCVKNGYRHWARAGIRESLPDTFEQYKQRAGEIIERRVLAANSGGVRSEQLAVTIGKLFLNEDEIVHSYVYFGDKQHFQMRDAQEHELPQLGELYQRNLANTPPYLTDDSHQEQYFREIWQARPSSIQVIEDEQNLRCFYINVPYNAQFRAILKKNPATHKWAEATVPQPDDWFCWIISTWPASDPEMIGYVLRHVFLPSLYGKRMTCMPPSMDQAESARLIGFELLDSFHYTTPGGLTFYFCQLDARPSGQETVMENMQTAAPNTRNAGVWFSLTKKLLSTYQDPDRQTPLLQQCKQLWRSDMTLEQVGERIRHLVAQHLEWLKGGDRQEHMQSLILQHACLKKSASHERIAERLNIPSSTYYRQLKKAIQSVADHLERNPG